MAAIVLACFCLAIAATLALHVSLLWALGFGFLLFFCFALVRGRTAPSLARLALDGVRTVFQVCSTLLCIGLLTAAWRASGTIAYLVDLALGAVTPDIFLPCVFLCNCALSFILGSAFATAATMGVICMSVAHTLDFSVLLAGGAILAGCYFGDRCSPMSTSSLLVCTLAKVPGHRIMRALFRTCLPGFAGSLLLYGAASLLPHGTGAIPDTAAFFAQEYRMGPLLALPAILVLVLAFFRVHVRNTVLCSTALALVLCLFVQDRSPAELPQLLVFGFTAANDEVGRLMNGGGLISMAEVVGIVCISSTYAGLFRAGGLMDGLNAVVRRLAARSSFLAYAGTGLLTGAIACNQTLAIMLTHQLTEPLQKDPARHAVDMEDSVLLLAALVPWSIATTVPLYMVGAPLASIPLAFYVWLVPLSRLVFTPRSI